MTQTIHQTMHASEQVLRRDLQLFDLKQMVEFETHYRTCARESINALKQWRKRYEQQTDMVELLYGSIEGVMLRRRAEDFARLYWLVRVDVRQALHIYTGRLCSGPVHRKAA